ncbi:hypothetical protein [Micromonospora siamensis]|uniref:DUF3558 domain-containing protein n=1 Tax=Micromonospora siamensis TaxID=299152 RepID=A0A1C5HTC3_9ACTN|nr:hypothetical protein [Micromonospora siamensis]SCG48851.1 hypothetical protein GA0074704_2245 [Micromonospora siamensis]
MHGRIGLAGVAVPLAAVVLVTGCADEPAPIAVPAAPPARVEVVAASSGGACRLLDFDVILARTGTRFTVAAASTSGDTHTCVVRSDKPWPELALTVTDTSIDKETFTADVLPDEGKKVTKLGQIAYRRTIAAKSPKQGPAAEVCWLATEGRLATLRWTFGPGGQRATAEQHTTKLIALAKTVKTRSL